VAIGYYPRGCLQGGIELPITGPNWQVMRVSRNRNWGHPELVQFLERFAPLAAEATGWKGILIGDMAQPRGGPLPFGHRSHQIGLDVDIWFMPMTDRVLSAKERENISAPNLVAADGKHVYGKTWSAADIAFIRTAAEQPEVERVLVNAAIKKELCRVKSAKDESWMSKVRPWYGHADHIHVRLKCPADSPDCRAQPAVPIGDGCDKSLDHWFAPWILRLKIPDVSSSAASLKLKDLPPACAAVLNAPPNPDSAVTDQRSEPR
jgi:penicillin-insensitive murein endopeptidase